jgi:uncharacterized protein YqjF (DUF2071 family)
MTHGPHPTVQIRRAVMTMRWDDLTFLHWAYPPEVVQRLLPPGLHVQMFEGRAWVSLVPFEMKVLVPGTGRVIPWLGRFAETNVRTYVTAGDGTEGIWFFSLDATRLVPMLTARAMYRLPYEWSAMTVDRSASALTYTTRRRWPGPRGAHSAVSVQIGEPIPVGELTELDHFLSARWRLFSSMFGSVWSARAVHEPWPLRRGELLRLDDGLMVAAGLPRPTTEPIVQIADRVTVRIGMPHRVRVPVQP